jgi:3-oxoacyl-[acyl-carrier-protein] synthase II
MNSSQRRVVITGMNVICPVGSSKEALWDGLVAGRSGVVPLQRPASGVLPMSFGAPVDDFEGKIDDFGELEKEQKKLIRKGLKVMCRECQMGVATAQKALTDAGLKPADVDPERTGISYGADYMVTEPEEFSEGIREAMDGNGDVSMKQWPVAGMPKMSPLWLLKYLPNMPASHLAIFNQFRGPNNSLTLREASGNMTLGEAAGILMQQRADVMLVGSTGTRLHPMKLVHCVQQEEVATDGLEPQRASRPFDRDHCGAVCGEGAGALVMECYEAAKRRGATVYGELLAHASSAVSSPDRVNRRQRAMENVLHAVLQRAGLQPSQIGHVHAHGLSTRSCDREEARAIRAVFGDVAVPVVAAKSHFGNLGAGGGVVELVASVMAMNHGQLFPVLNYENPDPECPLEVVADGAAVPGRCFINLSVTPQGQASAVLIGAVH